MPPLAPSELFPAGVAGLSARVVELSTGVHVRVVESGPPSGMPVVMLHGWGASLYMYRHALRLLPEHGFRAIAVDLRGYGLSDHPRARGSYSLDAYVADLDALYSALGLERAALIGQSMGGGIALRYALHRPERVSGLALINPVGLVSIGWVAAMRLLPRRVTDMLGARLVPRWLVGFILRRIAYGDPSLVSERDVDEYWAPTQAEGFARALRAGITEFSWAPVSSASASSLAVPTIVVIGDHDRVVRRASGAATRLAGARVVSVRGGHCVHEERPDEVYPILANFLTGATG